MYQLTYKVKGLEDIEQIMYLNSFDQCWDMVDNPMFIVTGWKWIE